jgi:tryptophan 2,3-dioxygenase
LHSEEKIDTALDRFGLEEYVTTARSEGRQAIPEARRAQAAELYETVLDFRNGHSLISRDLDDTLELAHRFLYPEWFLARSPAPRYRAYTNVGVLNWYLGTVTRLPYQRIWTRCARAIHLLLRDVITFEVNSLAGLESRSMCSFDKGAARDRVERLRALLVDFGGAGREVEFLESSSNLTWTDYTTASGMEHALLRLTVFPQTCEHDEYLFLRAIHISECCFWGILTATLATVESIKRAELRVAESCLAVATPFASVLTPLFQAVKTMTPDQFRRFRDATGEASAVQSRTYQLMQIALLGANPDTMALIAGVPGLEGLRGYDHPAFTSLAHLTRSISDDASAHAETLRASAAALDTELRKWRTLHLGIARNYLADIPTGTGGTSGPEYLRLSVQRTIEAVEEALSPDVRYPPEENAARYSEELLWPEEKSIARRLSNTTQPYLTPEN